jgi:hypothetical protein
MLLYRFLGGGESVSKCAQHQKYSDEPHTSVSQQVTHTLSNRPAGIAPASLGSPEYASYWHHGREKSSYRGLGHHAVVDDESLHGVGQPRFTVDVHLAESLVHSVD